MKKVDFWDEMDLSSFLFMNKADPCKECGQLFLKKSKGNAKEFCRPACYIAWRKKEYQGIYNPHNWREDKEVSRHDKISFAFEGAD